MTPSLTPGARRLDDQSFAGDNEGRNNQGNYRLVNLISLEV